MCLKTLLIFAVTGVACEWNSRFVGGQGMYLKQNYNIEQYLISTAPLNYNDVFGPRASALYMKHDFSMLFDACDCRR
jgi:hypothetical protein